MRGSFWRFRILWLCEVAARNDHTRRAAVTLLQRGLATPFEIATVSGMSRQLCCHWAREYTDSRAAYLQRIWGKALANASETACTIKADGRKTVALHRGGVPIKGGDLVVGQEYTFDTVTGELTNGSPVKRKVEEI